MKALPPVKCDVCDETHTKNDTKTGGMYIPGWCVCPDCMAKIQDDPLIMAMSTDPEPGETFFDFVTRLNFEGI